MAVAAVIVLSRSAENVSGNKRWTGGTMTFTGTYDATATAITSNRLGLKKVEWLDFGNGYGSGADTSPVIGTSITATGVSIKFYGGGTAASPLTECTGGTVADSGTVQWRAMGY